MCMYAMYIQSALSTTMCHSQKSFNRIVAWMYVVRFLGSSEVCLQFPPSLRDMEGIVDITWPLASKGEGIYEMFQEGW